MVTEMSFGGSGVSLPQTYIARRRLCELKIRVILRGKRHVGRLNIVAVGVIGKIAPRVQSPCLRGEM
jgi:hypothetical protein